MGADQMRLSDEENSLAYLTNSISAVDCYPWICSQTTLSPTDLLGPVHTTGTAALSPQIGSGKARGEWFGITK